MARHKNQRSELMAYMKAGNFVTNKIAAEKFGIQRLSGIIFDWRKAGILIKTVMCEGTTRYGDSCRYAKYFLMEDEE